MWARWLATPVVVLTAGGVDAQESKFFRTHDGSSFLLVKVDSRVVHWINLQPARIADQPEGLPGLAVAVGRASLSGGATERAGEGPPLRWEKALRRAPSTGAEFVEAHGYLGVAVTFPNGSIPLVAELLRVRTQRAELAGIEPFATEAIRARRERLLRTPHLGMLRRLLGSIKGGEAFLPGLTSATDKVTQARALELYRNTYSTNRALNVITGGFDIQATEEVLRRIYSVASRAAEPQSESTPVAPRVRAPEPAAPPDRSDTLLLACPLPTQRDPVTLATIDLLVEYLAGDADGFLPDRLRAAGHPRVEVAIRAPFPEPGGYLVVEVTDPGSKLDSSSKLVTALAGALDDVAKGPADAIRLSRAATAARAARTQFLHDPRGLAVLLAHQWARSGSVPSGDLAIEARVTPVAFQALASEVLATATRTLILPELR